MHSALQRAVLGEKPNEGGSDSSVGLEFEFGKILGGGRGFGKELF